MTRRICRPAVAGILLALALMLPARAARPDEAAYHTYLYNYWGQPVASPAGFLVEETKNGLELGVGRFFEPKDLYISPSRDIYVADSGNDRVLVFDGNWAPVRTIDRLTGAEGQEDALKTPSGVFVDRQGAVYIADTGNKRVVKCDSENRITALYTQPKTDIAFTGIDFLPQRVLTDEAGYVYVLCQGIYQGALTYENDGAFVGYYGTNYVESGFLSALRLFWRSLATEEQRSKMERFVSEEINSFDIDGDGFIYTATEVSETSRNQIKRINPLGVNVMDDNERVQQQYQGRFGDLELRWYGGKVLEPRFVDVSYDGAGFINALDRERGRVFQYDTEGNLIMVGGGNAGQEGTFKKVAAVESLDDRILVLDELKASVTVFRFTDYGREIRRAVRLYTSGQYGESREGWESVLQKNANCELAYSGIGKALYEEARYGEAMRYFKLGHDRPGYGKAFTQYRAVLLKRGLPWAATVILGAGLAFFIWNRGKRLKRLLEKYRE